MSPGQKLIELGRQLGYKPGKLGPLLGVTEYAIRNYNRSTGRYNPSRETVTRMIELAAQHGIEVTASWFADPDSPVPHPRRVGSPVVVREAAAPYAAPSDDERAEFTSACLSLVDALDSVASALDAQTGDDLTRRLACDWVRTASEILQDLAGYELRLGATGTCRALESQHRRVGQIGARMARSWGLSPA